jgi:hypothetical protein
VEGRVVDEQVAGRPAVVGGEDAERDRQHRERVAHELRLDGLHDVAALEHRAELGVGAVLPVDDDGALVERVVTVREVVPELAGRRLGDRAAAEGELDGLGVPLLERPRERDVLVDALNDSISGETLIETPSSVTRPRLMNAVSSVAVTVVGSVVPTGAT